MIFESTNLKYLFRKQSNIANSTRELFEIRELKHNVYNIHALNKQLISNNPSIPNCRGCFMAAQTRDIYN